MKGEDSIRYVRARIPELGASHMSDERTSKQIADETQASWVMVRLDGTVEDGTTTHRSRLIMSGDSATFGFLFLTDSKPPLRLTGILELPGMVRRLLGKRNYFDNSISFFFRANDGGSNIGYRIYVEEEGEWIKRGTTLSQQLFWNFGGG